MHIKCELNTQMSNITIAWATINYNVFCLDCAQILFIEINLNVITYC